MFAPSLAEFKRVYYDRTNDYWDIADTWGVPRWQVDEWRRHYGLPSRRIWGTRRPGDDPDWDDPPAWNRYARLQPRWWDRRRIPPLTLTVVPVRKIGRELYCLVI